MRGTEAPQAPHQGGADSVLPGDRRRVDRRSSPRSGPSDAAWDAAAVDLNADPLVTAWSELPDSRFAGDWGASEDAAADAAALQGSASARLRPGLTAFQRIYRVFLGARAGLGLILVLLLMVNNLFGVAPLPWVGPISVAYAALALTMWLLPRFGRRLSADALTGVHSPQWLATIGVDTLCFLWLHVLSIGSSFNYAALLVMPVLMAGVLTPRVLALGTCSAITLVLLVLAWLVSEINGNIASMLTQAGVAGSGLFVITVLAGELAARLAREEFAARGSMELARQQVQLNRLVIEEMQDGVLVVDRRAQVRAANPAARRLLAAEGMSHPAPFELGGVAAWQELVAGVERAFEESTWPDEGRDLQLSFDPEVHRTVRVRVRFARRRRQQSGEDYCVLLLEDLRKMQARVRQEKLAAMGRVSAGIAHEIRNPLAAISQANALMAEDATTPAQRQLTQMVSENVARLKRIVDDVMEVAPGRDHEAAVVDLTALVASVCSDWARGQALPASAGSALRLELPDEPLAALFDPDHLRRVLINLLDNALRHASGQPASVLLRLFAPDADRAILSVASDGAPIVADVERFLFEPFFSTRSRGTGLGLYICRELCERYGASINYRTRPSTDAHRNDFSVVMKRVPWVGQFPLPSLSSEPAA